MQSGVLQTKVFELSCCCLNLCGKLNLVKFRPSSLTLCLLAQVEAALTSDPGHVLLVQPPHAAPGTRSIPVDETDFLDPLTFSVIVDPVLGTDGVTYDRLTAYRLMTEGCNMPGCAGRPFAFSAPNLYFRKHLRRAHPETAEAMQQQQQEILEVHYFFFGCIICTELHFLVRLQLCKRVCSCDANPGD